MKTWADAKIGDRYRGHGSCEGWEVCILDRNFENRCNISSKDRSLGKPCMHYVYVKTPSGPPSKKIYTLYNTKTHNNDWEKVKI